ncbi:MAG: glutamate--cysteine ligase [Gammaproteobacteria bacterium]
MPWKDIRLYSSAQKRLSALVNSGRQSLLQGGLTGLEKESLRVGPDGSITQTPHPAVLGSALTHPWITTDYSEALLEFITPPLGSPEQAVSFLRDVQHFVYKHLENELLWSSSMPCVVAGEASIPIAQYGTSNAGLMKTVYRRGLGYRYGRVMQVIAGAHYNYSFPDNFWPLYQQLERDDGPLEDFISDRYFHLIRNIQRIGWLVPFLFGSSPAVCKSFMCGNPTTLEEFNDNSYYGKHATSLRMCDIGYQNSFENEVGFKATYDSLRAYVESLTKAIETPCPRFQKIGIKVDGEYRQLNANMLQIENEYYSSVRPKQVPGSNEKPSLALLRRGVRYVELRSLDINVFDAQGISETQCRFLETLMAFCLMQDSPVISENERSDIDYNLDAVCYRGREPGLALLRNGKSVTLSSWASELCDAMTGFADVLDENQVDNPYRQALQEQTAAIRDPDKTPSAQVLDEMRAHGEGYFHFAQRMSRRHQKYYLDLPADSEKFSTLAETVRKSLADQREMEDSDEISFDEFLENYFAQQL